MNKRVTKWNFSQLNSGSLLVKTICFFTCFFSNFNISAQRYVLDEKWWIPYGFVNTISRDSATKTIYIGGGFKEVGPHIPFYAKLSTNHSKPDFNFAKPNGKVYTVCPDGKGGCYIGGYFSKVGDSVRTNIAHINSNGSVSNKFSGKNKIYGTVDCIFLTDTNLYVSGGFNSYGVTRQNMAQFQINNDFLETDFPEANGGINCVITDGKGGWYVGGKFTKLGDSIRTYLGHIDNTGKVSAWNPKAGGPVSKLLKVGNLIYVGGFFKTIGTQNRTNLAAIDTLGKANSWNPNVDGEIFCVVNSNDTLYFGGNFHKVGSLTRNCIAAIKTSSNIALNWNPSSSAVVNCLAAKGNTIYAGGSFSSIGGQTRYKLAALSRSSGNALSWKPDPDNEVNCFLIRGNTLYIGGKFNNIGGFKLNGLVSVSIPTGIVNNWDAKCFGQVASMAAKDTLLYITGYFTSVGGKSRHHLAVIDSATAQVGDWHAVGGQLSSCIAVFGNKIFTGTIVGGIGGLHRNRVMLFNASTLKVSEWNPNLNGSITSMVYSNNTLFVAGSFSKIGEVNTRNNIAAFNTLSGELKAWNPNSWGWVNSIYLHGKKVYVAGLFDSIGGKLRKGIACLDSSTGIASNWNANSNSYANTVFADSNMVYVGGTFTKIGGYTNNKIASLDSATAIASSLWNTNLSTTSIVNKIIVKGNIVYFAGDFTDINYVRRCMIAAVDKKTGKPNSWNPCANDDILDMQMQDTNIFVAGNFVSIGGIKRHSLASLDERTGELKAWNPSSQYGGEQIHSIYPKGSNVYIGGSYTELKSFQRMNIGKVDTSGNVSSWNPVSSSGILGIIADRNVVYVCGYFSSIGGQNRKYLAALDANTGKATSWNPNPNKYVYAISLNKGKLFAGGIFSNIGGKNQNGLVAIDTSNGNASDWDTTNQIDGINCFATRDSIIYYGTISSAGGEVGAFSTNYARPEPWKTYTNDWVNGIAVHGRFAYIGGEFTNVNGTSRSRFAELDQKGNVTDWKLRSNDIVNTVFTTNKQIMIGGDFTMIDSSLWRTGFAVYERVCGSTSKYSLGINTCGPYTLNFKTYTTSGTYIQNLISYNGCDSILTLQLKIKDTDSTIKREVCDSFKINNSVYKTSGKYIQKFKNSNGCDSILYIELKVLRSDTLMKINACDSFYLNGVSYKKDGTYNQKLKNFKGCDSTIIVNLSILNTDTLLNVKECNNYILNGKTYGKSGIYKQVIQNHRKCDSTINLQLILQSNSLSKNVNACRYYTENGKNYTVSGNYVQTLTNKEGCDSVLTINLTLTTPNDSVKQNGKTLVAVSSKGLYQWLDCNNSFNKVTGATSKTFVATSNSSYALQINEANCFDTSACFLVNTISFNPQLLNNKITVYPIPASTRIYIQTGFHLEKCIISIDDISGRNFIREIGKSGSSFELETEGILGGVYILKIETANTIYRFRVIIE